MAYGDLSQFLPSTEEGTKLDIERAKAYGSSRAQYLSSMDQFYEQLDESQRQFDIAQALQEKQFEWQSEFSERQLSQERELTEAAMLQERELTEEKYEIERTALEDQMEMFKAQMKFAKEQEKFSQELASDQFALQKYTTGLEAQLLEKELGGSNFTGYNLEQRWRARRGGNVSRRNTGLIGSGNQNLGIDNYKWKTL
jgi:hypothetical protein